MEFQWNIRLFSRCFCWRSHAHHAQVQTKSAGSATRAYLLSVGLASTAAPAVLLVSSVRRLSCGKVRQQTERTSKPGILLHVHMIPPRRLAGPSREPRCYLARFPRSQSNQCKIRKTKLAISTMAPMLASPRGDLHFRFSLQSPIKKMVASEER